MSIPQIAPAAPLPDGPAVCFTGTCQLAYGGEKRIFPYKEWYSGMSTRRDVFGITILEGSGNSPCYILDVHAKIAYKLNRKLIDKSFGRGTRILPLPVDNIGPANNGLAVVYLGYICRLSIRTPDSVGSEYAVAGTAIVHGIPVTMFSETVNPEVNQIQRVTSIIVSKHMPPGVMDIPRGFKIVELNENNYAKTLRSLVKDVLTPLLAISAPKSALLSAPPAASPLAASPAPPATPALSPPAIFPGECPFAVPGGGWAYAPPGTLVKLPDGTTFTLGKNSQQ